MKKKIAVFAGGWGGEYLQEVLCGITEAAKTENADIFVFVNFSVPKGSLSANMGEVNLFTLPDLSDFDGVILMANSFNCAWEITYFTEKLKETGIPAVSIEYDMDNIVSVFTDNYAGMYDLAKHVIVKHGARNILFIGGPKEHKENEERLKALLDAARENGVVIPEANIKYGDWSKLPAVELMMEWLEENEALPDAVLCANDIMAMGICEQLEKLNYRIPEDVIVTGYDCLRDAQKYHPSVTSVNHEWGRMGVTALAMLMGKIRGEAVASTMLKTRFVPGGSCGCDNGNKYYDNRQLGRISRNNEIDGLVADSHFRHIYLAVRKAENAEELSKSLSDLFAREHPMEGENFMLCLEPEFFHIEEGDLNLRSQGYSERMEVIGALSGGKEQPCVIKSKKDAMFFFSREKDEPGLYLYVPVYSDAKTYGFAILTGDMHIACDNQLYIWTRHMNQYLEQVRRNITIADLTRKLTQLSVTDVLTGVYNRAGCEKIAYPMLQEWKKSGGTGVIMLVDVDKMKAINDLYGHANGDLALRTVATVLKAGLPEDWIISRFGGDEFFVGGRLSEDEIDLNALCASLENRLEQEVERREIKFRLTISIGSVRLRPDENIDIEKYLQMADEAMYRVKDVHHRLLEEKQ